MLGVVGADSKMFKGIKTTTELNGNLSAIFIDFIDPKSGTPEQLQLQTEAISTFVEYVPLIVFDRMLSLTEKEVAFLKKYDTVLLEPALNFRKDFEYLPNYIEIRTFEEIPYLREKSREIDFVFPHFFSDRYSEFKKFYFEIRKLVDYKSEIVCYDTPDSTHSSDFEKFKIKSNQNTKLNQCKFTILVGSEFEYNSGYLYSINEMLKANVIPLLPRGHKYFNCLFEDTIIENAKDVKFFLESWETMYLGLILNVYERVINIYPEMLLENVNKKIKQIVEEINERN